MGAASSHDPATKGNSPYVALTGNPNSGKTTVFNALTGLRAKIGNYAGVTVERKEGRLRGAPRGQETMILDLPGTYSLSPKSLDERIARDALINRLPEIPAPRVAVVVVDASNLQRHLYYATQVIELGLPTVVALNMLDVAEQNSLRVDHARLAGLLGVPVIPMVASTGKGIDELRAKILELAHQPPSPPAHRSFCQFPEPLRQEIATLAGILENPAAQPKVSPAAAALLALAENQDNEDFHASDVPGFAAELLAARQRLAAAGVDWRTAPIEARYARVSAICQKSVLQTAPPRESVSDRLDRVVTHRIWGMVIFLGLMAAIFQSIFVFAQVPMEWISKGVEAVGSWAGGVLAPGPLNDLLVNGVIQGVGAVLIFLPQILCLFLFICLLEDTGYMARAAFIMDHLMSKVGLHGKSFIPMISSYACAIPGIMATRTIESPKDRLVTILIAPLMSCSARLPVYTVLIAACIPDQKVLGIFKLPGLTLLAAYLLGTVSALVLAWFLKKTLLKATTPLLIMELPPYKRPVLTVILRHMWERSKLFLTQAGTVILGINILLWFLASYPKDANLHSQYAALRALAVTNAFPELTGAAPEAIEKKIIEITQARPASQAVLMTRLAELNTGENGERLRHSFAGRLGHVIEPVIAPLGFDWKIGIGILSSFAAREVFVSTMSIVYNVAEAESDDAASASLAKVLQAQKRPDGTPVYTTLTGITLIVFYVYALQCASTVAVVKRETNSWKWPLIQWLYLGLLAWGMSFLVYQGGRLLGWG